MDSTVVTVRKASDEDVKYLLEFTTDDKWDYSMFDYTVAMSIDPDFLFAAVDSSNTPIGFGGISQISPGTMYLDTYIVRKDLRRKGIGRAIWRALMKRAGQSNVCLDGGLRLVEWYRKQGFIHESYKIHYFTAVVTHDMKAPVQSYYFVTAMSDSLWPALMEYDKQVYLDFDREKILRAWFQGATVVVASSDDGKCVGYGSMHKKCENSYSIKNVFSDNEIVVETILRHLCATLPDESVVYFVMMNEKPLPTYFRSNLNFHGTTKRLYSKAEIRVNTEKIWMHTGHKV